VTCTLHSSLADTTSSALQKKLFCLEDSVHSGSCNHQTHFRKRQLLTIIASYSIAAVFELYARIVSKLKGYGMKTSVLFPVTAIVSAWGSSRAAPGFTNIATDLTPVVKRSEFNFLHPLPCTAKSVTT
jgi:hypothetical protein